MHIQDCEAPGYKVPVYNTGELRHDQIKNSFPGILFLTNPQKDSGQTLTACGLEEQNL
jgi:hypothetical protein